MSTTEDMLAATVDPAIRLDVERLAEVRDLIASRPAEHNQNTYGVCGTARCVAGWAVQLAGISDEQVYGSSGDYPLIAGVLLGLRAWRGAFGLPEEYRITPDPAHVFYDDWTHDQTLQNLDALIALGKERDEAARLEQVFAQ